MSLKHIIESVIILVIALFIFSYIFNPFVKYETKQYFSDIKNKLSSNIEKIPTSEKIECEEKAKELVPKYLILPRMTTWKDNTTMNKNIEGLRKGSKEGENINYIYLEGNSSYNKKIISKDGKVLGTRRFAIRPTLKEYDTSHVKVSDREITVFLEGNISTIYEFQWSGVTEDIKKIFNMDYLKIKMSYTNPGAFGIDRTKSFDLCDWQTVMLKEEGLFTCNLLEIPEDRLSKFKEVSHWLRDYSRIIKFEVEPDIFNNKIYEIIEPNIISCNWVSEEK